MIVPAAGGLMAAALLAAEVLAPSGDDATPLDHAVQGTPTATALATDAPAAVPASVSDDASLALGRRLATSPSARPDAAPFEVQTSFGDGGTFDLGADTTNSITLVFFIAAWCPTCPGEAIALRRLHEDYRDRGVTILIVDGDQDEGEPELAAFRELTGNADHYWALDRDFVVARALDVNTLDATIVIDAQGRIAYRDGSPVRAFEVIDARA